MEKDLRARIRTYLLKNPNLLNGDYQSTSERFGVGYEQVRSIARRIREHSNLPKEKRFRKDVKGGVVLSCEDSVRVKSLDDLVKAFNIDLSKWSIPDFEVGTYEVTGFDKNRVAKTITMYRSKAKLKPLPYHKDIAKLKKDWFEDMRSLKPLSAVKGKSFNSDGVYMLEIAAYDLHLGKVGIQGDSYCMDIARERMVSALEDLLYKSRGWNIGKIVFVVGNDYMHIDKAHPFPSTTKGTPQIISTSGELIYRFGRKLLIEAINLLSERAHVHVVVISGNHDRESMFHLGDALDLFYEESDCVTVDNGFGMMKCYKHGNSLVVFDHGDKVKPQQLPGIVMARFRAVLSSVKYIEVHRGHLHHVKSQRPVLGFEDNEFNGLVVRNLSSMCGTDQWHDDKGYVGAIKRAHAFVWSVHNGLQAQLLYNVPIE